MKLIKLKDDEAMWIKANVKRLMLITSSNSMYDILDDLMKKMRKGNEINISYPQAKTLDRLLIEMAPFNLEIKKKYEKRVKEGNEKSQKYLDETKARIKMMKALGRKMKKCL